MLTTPDRVRKIIGLTPDIAPDGEIEPYIEYAQREFLNDIACYVRDDTLTGSINGTNTTFKLTYPFLADRTYDGQITVSDIEVYKWGKSGKLSTRESVAVSSVDPVYGIVVLQEAPASTYDCITANYYYYPREIPNELVSQAVALLAGFYYVMREFLLIPERLSHGAYRFSHARPYMVLLDQYYRIRDMITAKLAIKGEHTKMKLPRKKLKEEAQ